MRASKCFLTILILLSLSGFAEAAPTITCDPVASAKKRYYDDPCEGITDAAEACFDDLNTEFVKHEKAKETSKEIDALAASYSKAIVTLRDEYDPELGRLGGSCFDHGGEIEVWIREMQKDLTALEKIREKR